MVGSVTKWLHDGTRMNRNRSNRSRVNVEMIQHKFGRWTHKNKDIKNTRSQDINRWIDHFPPSAQIQASKVPRLRVFQLVKQKPELCLGKTGEPETERWYGWHSSRIRRFVSLQNGSLTVLTFLERVMFYWMMMGYGRKENEKWVQFFRWSPGKFFMKNCLDFLFNRAGFSWQMIVSVA